MNEGELAALRHCHDAIFACIEAHHTTEDTRLSLDVRAALVAAEDVAREFLFPPPGGQPTPAPAGDGANTRTLER